MLRLSMRRVRWQDVGRHKNSPGRSRGADHMKYKVWRSHSDPEKSLHVLCYFDDPRGVRPEENWNAFVHPMIRQLGPWVGGPEGPIEKLRPVYREVLRRHGFMVIYCRPTMLDLEI